MSDWDDYESKDAALEPPKADSTLAMRIIAAKAALDAADAAYATLCDEAVALISDDFGEHIIDCGQHSIVLTRSERYEWDTDALKTILGGKELPFVKQKLSVDKRRFDALPEDEKKQLLPALTRKPGSVSIKVTSKGS
jgi:hypothetical protein